MDIHKPKPVHSLREFLSEIGVVVLGIAIALTGEQILEAAHWHHVVEIESNALKTDIQDQLNAVNARVIQSSCVNRRIAELEQIFQGHHDALPLRLKGPIGRPQNLEDSGTAWSIAISSQAASHMTLAEQGAFGGAYSNYENFQRLRSDADAEWVILSALGKPELLDSENWSTLYMTFQRVKAVEARISAVAPYVLSLNSFGVQPPKITLRDALLDPYSRDFCNAVL